MSMNYVVRKKVDKSGDKEVVRYYAASKVLQPEPVSNDELAQHRPNVVIMGEHNRIKEIIHYEPAHTVL